MTHASVFHRDVKSTEVPAVLQLLRVETENVQLLPRRKIVKFFSEKWWCASRWPRHAHITLGARFNSQWLTFNMHSISVLHWDQNIPERLVVLRHRAAPPPPPSLHTSKLIKILESKLLNCYFAGSSPDIMLLLNKKDLFLQLECWGGCLWQHASTRIEQAYNGCPI